jgi:predicted nuclease of restriction endonuclease-like (RecB) superfamily
MKKTSGKRPTSSANRDLSRQTTAISGQTAPASDFYQSVAELLRAARTKAYRAVNFAMVEAYWNVGQMIVEEEQRGKGRAEYGAALIRNLSSRLTAEFGKGFTATNLKYFRQFYLAFSVKTSSGIGHTLCDQLTWSHYRLLMRVEKFDARAWYLQEAVQQNWSVRALERQIHSLYYERLLMSKDKASVTEEMQQKTAPLAAMPQDFIKDPYVLEFLGIPDTHKFREAELEQAIIEKLQTFMLELGRGFAFVGRQHRISTKTKDFFIDLVFYNHILKCFVLIDLKTGELTHQDIGQMDMYIRLFEDTIKGKDDNPTVGLILCTEKDHTIVKYSVLEENKQLFAARYQLYLPSEQELIEEIEREKHHVIRELTVRYG